MSSVKHTQDRYANNGAKNSHQRTRQKERQVRGFKSHKHVQKILFIHGQINNLFNLGRHLTKVKYYKKFRDQSFKNWSEVCCA